MVMYSALHRLIVSHQLGLRLEGTLFGKLLVANTKLGPMLSLLRVRSRHHQRQAFIPIGCV